MKTNRIFLSLAAIGAASLTSLAQSAEDGLLTAPNNPDFGSQKVTIADLKKKIADWEGKSPEPTLDLSGALPPVSLPQVAPPQPPQVIYVQAPLNPASQFQDKALGWISTAGVILGAVIALLMKYAANIKELRDRLNRQDDRQKDTTNAVQALALASPPPVPVNAPVEPPKSDGARIALIAGLLAIAMGATGCAGFQVPANVDSFTQSAEGTYDPSTGATGGKVSGTIHFRDRSGK